MEVFKAFKLTYSLFDRMKNNDEQCPHVMERMNALGKLLAFVQQKTEDQLSDDMKEGLKKLEKVVKSADEVITKFTESHKFNQAFKAGDYKLEFENLNKSLTDTFVTLSAALHIYQEVKLEEQERKLEEQKVKLVRQEVKLVRQEKTLEEQEKTLEEQEVKLEEQEKTLEEQEVKLEEQEKTLEEQEKTLEEQEVKLVRQEKTLEEQEKKLEEQEVKLVRQERRMAAQEDKLAEQEDILLRVESKMAYESRAYYCVLQ